MKALNVAVRETPVGLVACLPPEWSAFAGIGVRQGEPPYGDIDLGDVLGVVTKCERCDGVGWFESSDELMDCEVCDAWGYAPLKFVKVLDVWPIYVMGLKPWHGRPSSFLVIEHGRDVWLYENYGTDSRGRLLSHRLGLLPDAVPGGVALHVEWTDCPTCDGLEAIPADHWDGPDEPPCGWLPCPTCQTPFVPPSDAPIVEVAQ